MKKILFLTLLLCTVLGATIPMSAKACCCCNDNHQNYDTAYPSATVDPMCIRDSRRPYSAGRRTGVSKGTRRLSQRSRVSGMES